MAKLKQYEKNHNQDKNKREDVVSTNDRGKEGPGANPPVAVNLQGTIHDIPPARGPLQTMTRAKYRVFAVWAGIVAFFGHIIVVKAMGIDLAALDAVVLSHGRADHTGGLSALLQHRLTAALEHRAPAAGPEFVCHPAALASRTVEGLGNIGMQVRRSALEAVGKVRETEKPLWLSERMVFLGEVPTVFPFETRRIKGRLDLAGGQGVPDSVPDDSALACLTDKGLVVVTGCAHAGICSVVEYAKEVTGCARVADIVGGVHLYSATDERVRLTAEYLRDVAPAALHPCHCTGKRAACVFAGIAPGEEVGVGLRLEY